MKKIIQYETTKLPCPRCLELAKKGQIRAETIQPLPLGTLAPLGHDGRKCCFDCAAADTLKRTLPTMDFSSRRICTGNERQEQYRLPGKPTTLVRPNVTGDFEEHLRWLDENNWFGINEEDRA